MDADYCGIGDAAWQDPMVLIFSRPGTVKVANLRRSPAVSLALDTATGPA